MVLTPKGDPCILPEQPSPVKLSRETRLCPNVATLPIGYHLKMNQKKKDLIKSDIDEVLSELEKNSIYSDDVCLIGSAALIDLSIEINDLDFLVRSRTNPVLTGGQSPASGLKWEVKQGYLAEQGFSDFEIFESYSLVKNGIRTILPELELARKTILKRANDSKHLGQITAQQLIGETGLDFELFRYFQKRMTDHLRGPKSQLKQLMKKIAHLVAKPSVFFAYVFQRLATSKREEELLKIGKIEIPGTIYMDVAQILRYQLNEGRIKNPQRLDLAVRHQAISKNSKDYAFGYKQYEKMQLARKGSTAGYKSAFFDLRESVQDFGFKSSHPVLLNRRGKLLDGAHRLSIAFEFDISELPVRIIAGKTPRDYGRHWFIKNGFENAWVEEIESYLLSTSLRQGLFFPMLIWPPYDSRSRLAKTSVMGNPNLEVIFDKKFMFNREEFTEFVLKVYEIDDVEGWEIWSKLSDMNFSLEELPSVEVEVLGIHLKDPRFRIKHKTGFPISSSMEFIKEGARKTANAHDTPSPKSSIIHAPDNYCQNREFFRLTVKSLPLESYLQGDKDWLR